MTRWKLILPLKPIPWISGTWALQDGPSHYLAANERGARFYVPKAELGQ